MDWFLIALTKYADFSGRARRKEYWMFILCYLIMGGMIAVLLGLASALLRLDDTLTITGVTLFNLAMLMPLISVSIRRMHDIGRKGWWILVPIANFVLPLLDSQPGFNQYGANPKDGEDLLDLAATAHTGP